jgi:hypothetical protein
VRRHLPGHMVLGPANGAGRAATTRAAPTGCVGRVFSAHGGHREVIIRLKHVMLVVASLPYKSGPTLLSSTTQQLGVQK